MTSETLYLHRDILRILDDYDYALISGVLDDPEEKVIFASGIHTIDLFSKVNMLFINLATQLDYITKVFHEFYNIKRTFNSYGELKSDGMTYRIPKNIPQKELVGTLFEKNLEFVKYIIAIRSHIVHNSAFNDRHKLYKRIANNKVIEQYILLPDSNDGALEKFRSRKTFYSQEKRWDTTIPSIIDEFYTRMIKTFEVMDYM